MNSAIRLRPMLDGDGCALTSLWVASWQVTMPHIDFAARQGWLLRRLAELSQQGAAVVCATDDADCPIGFVTIDEVTGEIDQLAVRPSAFGSGVGAALLAEAKRRSPGHLRLVVNQDNPRAVRFYEREGFRRLGAAHNPASGLPTWHMAWP